MKELSEIEKDLKEEIRNLRAELRGYKIEVERFREYFDRRLKEIKTLRMRIESLENEIINPIEK